MMIALFKLEPYLINFMTGKGTRIAIAIVLVLSIVSIPWFLNVPYYQHVNGKDGPLLNTSTKNGTNMSSYAMLRDQYLTSWQNLTFQSVFNTYIKEGSATAYGVYEPRQSNTFSPGDTLYLYVEPVGYTFIPEKKESNTFSIDLSADTIVYEPSGREVISMRGIPIGNITSHHKNTELFVVLTLTPDQGVPEGDYVVKYIIKDNDTGKSFDIVKEIRLAAGLESRGIFR